MRSRFGLRAHVLYWEAEDAQGRLTRAPFDSVQGAQQGSVYGAEAYNAGLWWAGVGCAMRSYDHDCGD